MDNEKPTTSLNSVLKKFTSGAHELHREDLIAAFFNKFECLFEIFMNQGEILSFIHLKVVV